MCKRTHKEIEEKEQQRQQQQERIKRIGLNQNEFGSFNVSMSFPIYFDHSKSILIKNDFFEFDIVCVQLAIYSIARGLFLFASRFLSLLFWLVFLVHHLACDVHCTVLLCTEAIVSFEEQCENCMHFKQIELVGAKKM